MTGVIALTANILYTIVIPSLLLCYVYWRFTRRRLIELGEKIPGPKGWPLVGNSLEAIGITTSQAVKIGLAYSNIYKDIARGWLGPKLIVFITNPNDAEVLLSSNIHIDKAKEYELFQPWFGNGLLISTGQLWKKHRKIIAPAFHLSVLKGFMNLFNANSRDVVETLKKENGKTFDCHDYMSVNTVDTLLETVMGVSKNIQSDGSYKYAMAVMKMCDIIHLRHLKIWLRPSWLFNLTKHKINQKKFLNIIHALTEAVVKSKTEAVSKGLSGSLAKIPLEILDNSVIADEINIVEKGISFGQSVEIKEDIDVDDNNVGEKKRLPFLELMLDACNNDSDLSYNDIKNQVSTIMFEGHDTTAAASSFFLSLMAAHTDVQQRVHLELDTIFGKSNRPATFADTLEMKYLERCLLETLRLYPPVPLIARKINQDVKLASGYILPAGCTAVIVQFLIHRRPEIYPNPNVFDPDNFLPDRAASRHHYSFIPFSAGPRGCVGRKYAILKLKILLSTIMRNFVVKSDKIETDFELQADIILKRADGFPIRLQPRVLAD
ncbi:hypothetical protein FQA39_LY03692 [Lamprigera yunnana]|nr:hypothetical protein FQA39_LY03692 [Lamprigera yunnana]